MKHFFCQLFVVGSMLLLVASSASAATFTVTNVNGTGAGSLRQAVTDSNNSAGADTINFNLPAGPQTIMLLGGEILITDAVTINGPGSNLLTVNGNAVSRVFHIARNQIFVTISGLTVTNGMNTGIGFEGWGGEDNDFAFRASLDAPFDSHDDELLHLHHPRASLDGRTRNSQIPPLSWRPSEPIGKIDRFAVVDRSGTPIAQGNPYELY